VLGDESRPAPRCPACGTQRVEIFHRLSGVPVNSCILVDDRAAAIEFPTGDIELGFCDECGFIWNTRFDASLIEYSASYEETQAFSPRFRAFADALARQLIERHDLRDRDILEIGCGKGEFLALLCELGPNRGIGIDPSFHDGRLTSPALPRMRFIRDFFDESRTSLTGDLIACRHTLEHIGPVADFVRLIRSAAGHRPAGTVFIEVPDVIRVLREVAFWDIYYEHCSYFSPGSLVRLFEASGFGVEQMERVFDDQYLLLTSVPGRSRAAAAALDPPAESVDELRTEVDRFRRHYDAQVQHWHGELARLRGRRVVLWGSGSKAVAWLTTLGVGDAVAEVVDINPLKVGKFLAGTGHEIVAPERLASTPPDAVIIMNPIYRDEIEADLRRLGVRAEVLTV
jgi:SAM-dependent methyltransferase